MTKVNVILAWCEGFGIGISNNLPWRIPGDLKRFSRLTTGEELSAVIMGKNTWNSLPKKPLKERINIIVSTTMKQNYHQHKNDAIVTQSLKQAIDLCEANSIDTCWIIGGQQLLASLPVDRIDTAEITVISESFQCDTFVPPHVSNHITTEMNLSNVESFKQGNISGEYRTYTKRL